MSKRKNLPSAHDVARLAGVSQAAVSRAFTPMASISAATREKVLHAASELGYRPNLLARSLITGRSGIVGVVIGHSRNPFFFDALDALSTRLSSLEQHILVFTARSNDNADIQVTDLLKFRVDALLLMSANVSGTLTARCREEGIPVIFFNRRPDRTEATASVTGANRLGAGRIADHLVAQGYRDLAFIGGPESASTSRERDAGFTGQVVRHGLAPPLRVTGHYGRDSAMAGARLLLSGPRRPDAIFCATDHMAFGAIDVARAEFGLEIGRELGIAGFDDIEEAGWPGWDLTSYSQPVARMIDKVVEVLTQPYPYPGDSHFVVEGELTARGSTRRG